MKIEVLRFTELENQLMKGRNQNRVFIKNYFTKGSLEHMLAVLRDYNALFSGKVDIGFMQPNSGLSLKLG